MTRDEIGLLLGSCVPYRRLCYEVAFASGLRAGELRALRVRNLDRDEGGLRLEAAWTKNRKDGFQPLPRWLVDRLIADVGERGTGRSAPLCPFAPGWDLYEDLDLAGIKKVTSEGKLDFHACRVAYVSWVLEAGASIKEAQVLARHVTPSLTLNTYGRARNERLSEVAEAVGKNLASTTGAQSESVLLLTIV